VLPRIAAELAARQAARRPPPDLLELSPELVEARKQDYQEGMSAAQASGVTCPQCGGAIWEFDGTLPTQFRCHTGHVFSTLSLVEDSKSLESALWAAARALDERQMLLSRMAAKARDRGARISAKRFQREADVARRRSQLVRRAIAMQARREGGSEPRLESPSGEPPGDPIGPLARAAPPRRARKPRADRVAGRPPASPKPAVTVAEARLPGRPPASRGRQKRGIPRPSRLPAILMAMRPQE
jgi:hypothetical protein